MTLVSIVASLYFEVTFRFSLKKVESVRQLDTSVVYVASAPPDEYDYRSILLWLSLGCLGVFAALRLLRRFLNNSEKKSEMYRISQYQQQSVEELKSIDDMK